MAYELQQVRDAIVRARSAGDKAAVDRLVRLASQIAMSQVANQPPQYNPTEGMSTMDRLKAGTGRGMTNIARQVGNIAGLVSNEDLAAARQLDQPLLNTGAGKVGNFLGEVAATAPLTGGLAGLAGRAGLSGLASNVLGRGAFEGAIQGGITAGPGHRLGGAALGGILGTALPAAGIGAKKLVQGVTRTPAAQELLNAGVDLTPGQLNPSGPFNMLEQAYGRESIPLVGTAISGARESAQQQFNRLIVERAAAPGAKIEQGTLGEMLNQAYDSFEPFYAQARGWPAKAKIMRLGLSGQPDMPLSKALSQVADDGSVYATEQVRRATKKWLANRVSALRGEISTTDLLRLRSTIRAQERNAIRAGNEELSGLLNLADQRMTEAIDGYLPPRVSQMLKPVDAKYAMYKQVEDAVARAGDAGRFTSSQLSSAVKRGVQEHAGKGAYARGAGGELRGLAQAGRQVFETKVPATGTRNAMIGLPAALAYLVPGSREALAVAGAGALGAITTKTGRRLVSGSTTVQKALNELATKGAERLSPSSRMVLAELMRRLSVQGGLQTMGVQ